MAENAEQMKALVKQRTTIKRQLTRLANASEAETRESNLQVFFEQTKPLFEKFEEVQSEIETLADDEDEDQFTQVFQVYNELMGSIRQKLSACRPVPAASPAQASPAVTTPAASAGNNACTSGSADGNTVSPAASEIVQSREPRPMATASMQLPTLQLPKFSGELHEWLTFRDTFLALIHDNLALSDVQRFHYLKSTLRGEAERHIQALSVTAENYEVAWELLVERFENKRAIIEKLNDELIHIPVFTKGNLRETVDGINQTVRTLQIMKQPIWDSLLVSLIKDKFSTKLVEEWETASSDLDLPTYGQIMMFLRKRVKIAESIETQGAAKTCKLRSAFVATEEQSTNCLLCDGGHDLRFCRQFLDKSAKDRKQFVTSKGLCFNCIRPGHRMSVCKSGNCRKCGQRHHTLLHSGERLQAGAATALHSSFCGQALLATAMVTIQDEYGRHRECRALLDCGSHINFMTEACSRRLGLKARVNNQNVVGVGCSNTPIKSSVDACVKARHTRYSVDIPFFILEDITNNLPIANVDKESCDIPKNMRLADPNFNLSLPIDMLIGVEVFTDLLCMGQVKRSGRPTLQKTHFGWIVWGRANGAKCDKSAKTCNVSTLEQSLRRFWEIEEVTDEIPLRTMEEQRCEELFLKEHTRDEEGRFIVKLPRHEQPPSLGESKQQAARRFANLERRLHKDAHLKTYYQAFMQEYEELGHMKMVKEPGIRGLNAHLYLPHHAVIKKHSSTTKIRAVFDASSKTSTGSSLNNTLLVGPVIQQDLFQLMTRFRTHRFALTADIEKMYRQILLDPAERVVHRILWRSNPKQPVQTYELQTLTYGTSPASFIATRCLKQLSDESMNSMPTGALIVARDFYMDDLITGASTLQECQVIQGQVRSILSNGRFHLRKWTSNEPALLKDVDDNCETSVVNFEKGDCVKTLGIQWTPAEDVFTYQVVNEISVNIKLTKRVMLSMLASIFDPLGLIAPVIITGKIIMQELWKLKHGWDDELPVDVCQRWVTFGKDIMGTDAIRIERHVLSDDGYDRVEVHGFCDASASAFGASIYLRTLSSNGQITCKLLCAKSRVAPLKEQTIPRLELCAALLLVKLFASIENTLCLRIDGKWFWSDSTIVLAWIKANNKRFEVFVANRVRKIRENSEVGDWHHVRSQDNPADVLSRGTSASSLSSHHLWWMGPGWLQRENNTWPVEIRADADVPDHETCCHMIASSAVEESLIDRFSTYGRMIRTMSWCRRFSLNCRTKTEERVTGTLMPAELEATRIVLVKLVQVQAFADEVKHLENKGTVQTKSRLIKLSPFMQDGVIRVGGRLRNANLEDNAKFPIVLPAKHKLTKLIIEQEHVRCLHAGPQTTIAFLRQQYWVLNARNVVRGLINRCITCYRTKPRTLGHKMGDLPIPRVKQSHPFEHCGVDYAGPINIKQGGRRSRSTMKSYIAVFICMATKAVHIELVCDLTTPAFLAALKKVMARRGRIAHMYADNAKTFVGAERELEKLKKQALEQAAATKIMDATSLAGIQWHFIPPRAPHFGGLWEAGVKSIKTHLRRIVGNASLNYDEMNTVLIQIESVLNSRPLCPMSSDPNDCSILTPAHLLVGRSLMNFPEPDLSDIQVNRLSRWQHTERLRQHFWRRWSQEYLTQLQERHTWFKDGETQAVPGQLVLIKEDNVPPLLWPRGRIIEVFPGADGTVRAVSLQTEKGLIKRPVRRLCLLPIEDNEV